MFEPEPPKARYGTAYEKWSLYWYAKFDKENEKHELNVEYMQRRRVYMQRRWEDALRKVNGVQRPETLPDLETI